MNNKRLTVLAFIFITTVVSANESIINIKGRVIASPCIVNADTVTKSVALPRGEARDMIKAGTGGEWVDFMLELDECPAYLRSAVVKFSGEPDVDDPNMYKNLGDANNIALQMAARTTTLGTGSTMKADINPTTHKAFFALSARMYSPLGNVSIGTFSSVVGVDFTYQ